MGVIAASKMPKEKAKGGWIQDAIKKPGALRLLATPLSFTKHQVSLLGGKQHVER